MKEGIASASENKNNTLGEGHNFWAQFYRRIRIFSYLVTKSNCSSITNSLHQTQNMIRDNARGSRDWAPRRETRAFEDYFTHCRTWQKNGRRRRLDSRLYQPVTVEFLSLKMHNHALSVFHILKIFWGGGNGARYMVRTLKLKLNRVFLIF